MSVRRLVEVHHCLEANKDTSDSRDNMRHMRDAQNSNQDMEWMWKFILGHNQSK